MLMWLQRTFVQRAMDGAFAICPTRKNARCTHLWNKRFGWTTTQRLKICGPNFSNKPSKRRSDASNLKNLKRLKWMVDAIQLWLPAVSAKPNFVTFLELALASLACLGLC
jgi:hypothetical protein